MNDSETQVETAETELGETLGSEKITSVPLNGRSYTDLLSVQSGVTPISTSASQSGSSGAALLRQPRLPAVWIRDSFRSAVSGKAQTALF